MRDQCRVSLRESDPSRYGVVALQCKHSADVGIETHVSAGENYPGAIPKFIHFECRFLNSGADILWLTCTTLFLRLITWYAGVVHVHT